MLETLTSLDIVLDSIKKRCVLIQTVLSQKIHLLTTGVNCFIKLIHIVRTSSSYVLHFSLQAKTSASIDWFVWTARRWQHPRWWTFHWGWRNTRSVFDYCLWNLRINSCMCLVPQSILWRRVYQVPFSLEQSEFKCWTKWKAPPHKSLEFENVLLHGRKHFM